MLHWTETERRRMLARAEGRTPDLTALPTETPQALADAHAVAANPAHHPDRLQRLAWLILKSSRGQPVRQSALRRLQAEQPA